MAWLASIHVFIITGEKSHSTVDGLGLLWFTTLSSRSILSCVEQGKEIKREIFFIIFLRFAFPPHLSCNLLGFRGAGSTDARLLSSGQKITHEPWADAVALSLGTLQG